MANLRVALQDNRTLARLVHAYQLERELDPPFDKIPLPPYSGGVEKILADALEAYVGAYSLEAGAEGVERWLLPVFERVSDWWGAVEAQKDEGCALGCKRAHEEDEEAGRAQKELRLGK
ncbi:hypothetical protein JCM10213_001024 [Rhodosporidiobolus nylandii]